jgi:protein arginine kinase activator
MNYVCQLCKQAKATVHITDTAPKKRERHLCDDCAEKEGVIIKQQAPTSNAILQEFLKFKAAGGAAELSCPKCGRTFQEFQVKGLLGCPHDYEAFRAVLVPLLRRAHEGATQHVGKVPSTAGKAVRQQTGLLRLRRQLKDAIEQEDYERAAHVRDQIRALESA